MIKHLRPILFVSNVHQKDHHNENIMWYNYVDINLITIHNHCESIPVTVETLY